MFYRIFKAGFINFKRNTLPSWAAILITTITLSVVVSIILLQTALHFSLNQLQEKVDVAIFFNVGAPESEIFNLKDSIEQLPEVSEVVYTSSEDALAEFRERHKDDYPTIQALDELGYNPLGAYISVRAKDVSQYESIANFLQSDEEMMIGSANIIHKINYYQNELVIKRLNNILSGAQRLGFLLTLILVAISVIITFNTIRLTIYISREEIGVMRLVGASKTRIRGAFMVEGALYGITSAILTLLLFWPITSWLGKKMTYFFGINMGQYYGSNIVQIGIIVILSGIFLGVLSSFLATRKYLNK